MSRDNDMLSSQIAKRIEKLEKEVAELKTSPDINNQDWNDETLRRQWGGLSLRTTAYYRKQGLEYYKRGGRVFYTAEAREAFKKQSKNRSLV